MGRSAGVPSWIVGASFADSALNRSLKERSACWRTPRSAVRLRSIWKRRPGSIGRRDTRHALFSHPWVASGRLRIRVTSVLRHQNVARPKRASEIYLRYWISHLPQKDPKEMIDDLQEDRFVVCLVPADRLRHGPDRH